MSKPGSQLTSPPLLFFTHPKRKKTFNIRLSVNDKPLKEEHYIQYLDASDARLTPELEGTYFLCYEKTKRNTGLISKLGYFVNTNTLIILYCALIYPFLIYSLITWDNTYESNVNPLIILQKRAIRIITFAFFTEHTSPICK